MERTPAPLRSITDLYREFELRRGIVAPTSSELLAEMLLGRKEAATMDVFLSSTAGHGSSAFLRTWHDHKKNKPVVIGVDWADATAERD